MRRILILRWTLAVLGSAGVLVLDLDHSTAAIGASSTTVLKSFDSEDIVKEMNGDHLSKDDDIDQESESIFGVPVGSSFERVESLDVQLMTEEVKEVDSEVFLDLSTSLAQYFTGTLETTPVTTSDGSRTISVEDTHDTIISNNTLEITSENISLSATESTNIENESLNANTSSSSASLASPNETELETEDVIQQLHVHESLVRDDGSQNITNLLANETLEDGVHFMSFEEWKKQKQAELSSQQQQQQLQQQQLQLQLQQIQQQLQQKQSQQQQANQQVQNPGQDVILTNSTKCINNSSRANCVPETKKSSTDTEANPKKSAKAEILDESKPKTYKKMNNYASADCAATIVQTNNDAKGASSILKENKDTYMLNKCSTPNKFVVIELCQDILVNSIAIGNFEFFSSMFRKFRISVSAEFPASEWQELGEFEADNRRAIQEFDIANPLIWARYLKLEILSHYGNEFYCPISVLRIHGKTMMDDFKENTAEIKKEVVEEIKVLEENIDDLAAITTAPHQLSEECRVVLPHLRVNEFLKDLNTSTFDVCYPDDIPVESTPSTPDTVKSTQESIYQTIMKRLSLLESNATLSLLYIEEQSKLLSNAFSKLETRQGNRFQALLDSFNSTMTDQFLNFKQAYHNLEHKYFVQFEEKDIRTQHLLQESFNNIKALSDELRFQRLITILNIIFVICLLVYVIVTRDVVNIENTTLKLAKTPFITRRPIIDQTRQKSALSKPKNRRNHSSKKHKL